ncbi:MAG TPA: mandelate racemase/muconate lactonizing enzyme family protein [Parapedobacter sp.]|uniref:mandelate racemase/muconate lactonizing enzyme family protein n=1 Tax=Parapedobacter sp. TaxID=1958893 RepID=UPI002BBD0A24|nr:mandelate racemase/muconate lactonizing enzyme family protein [Parapedobacter sp.]HWK56231.1 mandelate racemase/muconate lactonizing enzyme family protein [Parapedobacter sp.]
MKITNIECKILKIPGLKENATSSSQDDLVVIVHTDEGICGIGETDTGPWLAKAAIESPGSHSMAMGMRDLLIGMDPFDTGAIWEKLYTYTCMSGRRGVVICAMGAIDMALWDIKGKALGLPVYKLLGGAAKETITPYASLQPYGDSVTAYGDSLIAWIKRAKDYGYSAAKIECTLGGPYNHTGLCGSDEEMTDIIRSCRRAVGTDMRIMVDVQYLWYDARSALRTIQKWDDLDIYFLETPLQIDNLEGYALLAKEAPMRIAAGEWQNTRFEFMDLLDKGLIDVAQPDVGRVGGLTEAVRVCDMAQDRGRLIVPHCWKSGIGIAATAHLAFATPHCPMIEFLPAEMCDSALRIELVDDPIRMINGVITLPDEPGLGITLNMDAVAKYEVD